MKVVYFKTENEFIKASADYILSEALFHVAQKNFFTLSLMGGSTPFKIYEKLTSFAYKDKFPWGKTYFFLGDERIVQKESQESNIFMINKLLFNNVDVPLGNKILPDINIKRPNDIAKDYEIKIKTLFKTEQPSFDLFLLGMGTDCHTASLFPDDSIWKNNKNLVLATSKPEGQPEVHRISMGLQLINSSKNVLMLVSGKEKKAISAELLKNIRNGNNPLNSPIPYINPKSEYVWHIY